MSIKQPAPFGLRMPDDLKGWVKVRARDEGRSMNNTIVQMLRETMKATGAEFGDATPAAQLTEEKPQSKGNVSCQG